MDNKIISYKKTDEFHGLVAELVQGCIEFQQLEGQMRIKFKYFLADTLVRHPAYLKWGKGNQNFLLDIATAVRRELGSRSAQRVSKTAIYDALQVYEKYPSEAELLKALADKHEPVYWSAALRLIGRDSSRLETTCRHCPLHYPKPCPAP